jgi:hypothetical protein
LVNGGIPGVFSPRVSFADQLTVARAAVVPLVVVLFVWDFPGHDYWATAVFAVAMATDWFDGRLARRSGRTSALGSLAVAAGLGGLAAAGALDDSIPRGRSAWRSR